MRRARHEKKMVTNETGETRPNHSGDFRRLVTPCFLPLLVESPGFSNEMGEDSPSSFRRVVEKTIFTPKYDNAQKRASMIRPKKRPSPFRLLVSFILPVEPGNMNETSGRMGVFGRTPHSSL